MHIGGQGWLCALWPGNHSSRVSSYTDIAKTLGRGDDGIFSIRAYAKADWSRFEKMPLSRAANRMNAYNTYLLMEQQESK